MVPPNADCGEQKSRLIALVKKEVKQIMEESVTKGYVHEDSNSVTSLCSAIEACLSLGLHRRVLGLFKTSSTMALLHRIAKTCPEAEKISKSLQDINGGDPNKRSSSSGSESFNRQSFASACSFSGISSTSHNATSPTLRFLWIRLALFEKSLTQIVEYLVANAATYYDRISIISDPEYGSILCSLLVGPCALEYTSAKHGDNHWSDTHSKELVQRHRLSSGHRSTSSCSRMPLVNFRRSLNTSADEMSPGSFKASSCSSFAKDYVESLHQNSRGMILYGKNNVQVQPKEYPEPLQGYFSLHKSRQSLIIKWTPNELLSKQASEDIIESTTTSVAVPPLDKNDFWAHALNINMDDVVYVHCHQNPGEDSGGTIVLVGHDGVQHSPIHFPEGGSTHQFLSCLETGLLPNAQLDPPLWSQCGIGKLITLPKLMRGRILTSVKESFDEHPPIDYVFRIVSKTKHDDFALAHSILDFVRSAPRRAQLSSCSTTGSSDCSNKSISIDQYPAALETAVQHQHQQQLAQNQDQQSGPESAIEQVCITMRRQIMQRAFCGWLAYVRHLSTVRRHLSGLVKQRITPQKRSDEDGLTSERWTQLYVDGVVLEEEEVFRLVYFGGVAYDLRKEVWPYLLGHYSFGMTPTERQKLDECGRLEYESMMGEWMAVNAIARELEEEKKAMAAARMSSECGRIGGSNNGASGPPRTDGLAMQSNCSGLSNDDNYDNEVFEDISDISEPEETIAEVQRLLNKDERRHSHSFERGTQAQDQQINDDMHLSVKPLTRAMKTSTDSGHVEEVFEGGDELAHFYSPTLESKLPTSAAALWMPAHESIESSGSAASLKTLEASLETQKAQGPAAFIVTKDSLDVNNWERSPNKTPGSRQLLPMREQFESGLDSLQEPKSNCVSPASSIGGVYSEELLNRFALNMHRIDKDVERCDRNYWYFSQPINLEKLRNVMSTYVWKRLDMGYMQGMCDLAAPLLVMFDDEALTHSCFCKLMERMIMLFPDFNAMDTQFLNMRSLLQILDPEIFELIDSENGSPNLYFCYRWFLLDFKREFTYDDVFATWELIWSARHIASEDFVLFLALALLETYREIILSNRMDFTDVIKFFNEMAERHNAPSVHQLARSLILQLQLILENK